MSWHDATDPVCRAHEGEVRLLIEPHDVRSRGGARVIAVGGEALGTRHLWWNFVSTSRERIDAAARQWAEDRFPRVPGDDERIPLPA